MSNFENSGPAFPVPLNQGEPWISTGPCDGMTLRQYAAIKLRVPNSGTDWLDEMIRTSLRDDLAAKAMQGLYASDTEAWHCSGTPEGLASRAKDSYAIADAMLAARGE